MLTIFSIFTGLLLYLEIIYHFSGFGFVLTNPLFTIFVVLAWAAVETLIVGVAKGKIKTILFQIFMWWSVVWTGAQIVYLHIFKQPMLWEAIFRGGQDAITNYWREALTGFFEVLPFIGMILAPAILICVLMAKKKLVLKNFDTMKVMRTVVVIVLCIAACIIDLEVGKVLEANYYENYHEFFDPLTVAEEMGVHPTLQRDTVLSLMMLIEDAILGPAAKPVSSVSQGGVATPIPTQGPSSLATPKPETIEEPGGTDAPQASPEPEVFVPVPNAFSIDYELLNSLADNKKQAWLAEYIQQQAPTMTNEYTGIFEGYNLIFLTAEGFSPYAVREDLTPTLYHMIHTGFVFDNYYVPLWQTSTSDGEYINCSGLIPDGQFSMRKSAANNMAYTLAKFFNETGIQSRAYHNNNLSYYDRHLSHPNLGYFFKSCNLGGLDAGEWGDHIFEMEGSGRWPASDYEMMISTMPEYINDDRFHAYYMTVSGHMNYNFRGNSMSSKNKEAVADLEMSENGQAYIACQIELDKALAYMLEELEKAGKLENTVIVLSADHYPYAMTPEQYEELAGKSLDYGKDTFRNNLILWNAAYEEEPVEVHKACGSMDLLPTILNLFGFQFDSRMYAGRDIFSDVEGMVIFNDRSFVTDGLIYNRKTKEEIWLKDAEGKYIVPEDQRSDYLAAKQQDVKDRYQFSAYILQENYYQDIEDSRIRE